MKINIYWFFAFFMFSNLITISSQPTFSNKTRLYKTSIPSRSLIPGGMVDIDGDLVDDLIVLDRGIKLKAYKSSGEHFSLELLDSIKISNNRKWTLTVGDINNDGLNDILTAGEYDNVNITTLRENKFTTKNILGNFYAQGSNTVDINNDGWLDYFVCVDDSHSKIFMNDKAGNLVLKNVIDFAKNDATDGSGNYGSEWVDVNNDFLPDLYISKCRAGVSDPQDLRRINRLYINNGDGTFEDKAASFNLNSGAQTWTSTFGDIDNDGDMDAFIVNHYSPHALMENIDGVTFREIHVDGLESSFGFQAIMRDFDNDGLLDIMMVGVEGSKLLYNLGNNNFKIIKNIIGPNQARSMSVGDINDDGFIDIHAHICEPINVVGFSDDELWLNNGNQKHYIKFLLQGDSSNRSAIGAQLSLFGPWGKKVRHVKGGESYGVFNSFQQHFGLGSSTIIDSLVVRWPSGNIDKYFNLEVDKTYFAQENKCMTACLKMYQDVQFFSNIPVTISAPNGMASYLWNDGNTSKSIDLMKEGAYYVRMTDTEGCVTISKPVVVKSGCFSNQVKLINEASEVKICKGDQLEINAISASSYIWSNGSTDQSITVNSTQKLFLSSADLCGNIFSDQISVEVIDVDFSLENDTIKKGENAILISNNKNTRWFYQVDSPSPFYIGDTLVTESLQNSTSYFASVSELVDKKDGKLGEKDFPLTNLYGSNNTDGFLVFDVEKSCILHSVKVNTDTEGKRKIVIRDKTGQVTFEKEIFLIAGIQIVVLDAHLETGTSYEIGTDTSINIQSLGYKGPRLVRTFNASSFPYSLQNIITIQSSSFGAIYYYYFYDWEISFDLKTCDSGRKEVIAFVDSSTALLNNVYVDNIGIYPNPAIDIININNNSISALKSVMIKDMQGTILKRIQGYDIQQADVSELTEGLYIIAIETSVGIVNLKMVKL